MSIKHGKGPGNRAGGLTLIELMIMVAIIGTLAAVTLSVYNNYMVRSELTGATTTLDAT